MDMRNETLRSALRPLVVVSQYAQGQHPKAVQVDFQRGKTVEGVFGASGGCNLMSKLFIVTYYCHKTQWQSSGQMSQSVVLFSWLQSGSDLEFIRTDSMENFLKEYPVSFGYAGHSVTLKDATDAVVKWVSENGDKAP